MMKLYMQLHDLGDFRFWAICNEAGDKWVSVGERTPDDFRSLDYEIILLAPYHGGAK